MADRARLGYFDGENRFQTLLDLNDTVNLTFVRDAYSATAPERQQISSADERRYGGSRVVSETHANGTLSMGWYIKDVGKDATLAKAEALFGQMEESRPGRYIEWRPEGATFSTFYELRGPAKYDMKYRWIIWQGTSCLEVGGAWPIAPLAEGDRLDTFDEFTTNNLSEYTFDAGSAGQLAVANGSASAPSSFVQKRLVHTAKGYQFADSRVTVGFTPGGSPTTGTVGVIAKRKTSSDYILGTVTNATLSLFKVVGGTPTSLGTAATITMATGVPIWVRILIDGNSLILRIFNTPPTPSNSNGANSVVVTLSAADAALFGDTISGYGGAAFTPADATWTLDSVAVEPFAYELNQNNVNANPAQIYLSGSIPGDAPAKFNFKLTETESVGAFPFSMVGWGKIISPRNYVWNGDFESNTTEGWALTSVAGLNSGAGTSITATGGGGKFGNYFARVVAPATANTGTHFKLPGFFKRGVSYTAVAWVRSSAGVTPVYLRLGDPGLSDFASGTATALTTTYTTRTVSWIPTADRIGVYLAVNINAATGTTFDIDGVTLYETSLGAPTRQSQSSGRGANYPIQVVEAESFIPSFSSNFVATTSSADSGTVVARWATSGAGTATLGIPVDTSLIPTDDFSEKELRVEVWARVAYANTHVTPRVILSALPLAATSGFTASRYSEWGSTGRPLTAVTAASKRLTRLGTLALSSNQNFPAKWVVTLTASVGVGSTGNFDIDYLLLVPARQRAGNITGKANNASYPAFISSAAAGVELTKTIYSNLSGEGTVELKAGNPVTYGAYADAGWGGAQLEISPGTGNRLVTVLSNLVPDDPTVDSTVETMANNSYALHLDMIPRFWLARGA